MSTRNSLRNSKTLRKSSGKSSRKLSGSKNTNTSRSSFPTNTYRNHHENLNACEKIILEDLSSRFVRNEIDEKTRYYSTEIMYMSKPPIAYISDNKSSIDMHFMDPDVSLVYLNNPLISIEFSGTTPIKTSHYKEIKTGDKILIWGILYKNNKVDHLAAQIITRTNKYFSFGFFPNQSYDGMFDKTSSSIITPDPMFDRKLIKHFFNEKNNKYVKLIAASILSENDIEKLFVELENIKDGYITSSNWSFNIKQSLLSKYSKLDQDILDANKKNNLLIADKLNILSTHSMYESSQDIQNEIKSDLEKISGVNETSKTFNVVYYELFSDNLIPYCLVSSKHATNHKEKANCSSFLVSLFDDVIKCSGILSHLIVQPSKCKQRDRSKVLRCTQKKHAKHANHANHANQSKSPTVFYNTKYSNV